MKILGYWEEYFYFVIFLILFLLVVCFNSVDLYKISLIDFLILKRVGSDVVGVYKFNMMYVVWCRFFNVLYKLNWFYFINYI